MRSLQLELQLLQSWVHSLIAKISFIVIILILIATMFSLPISSLSAYYDNPELDINVYPSMEAKRYYDSLNIQTNSTSEIGVSILVSAVTAVLGLALGFFTGGTLAPIW